MAAADWRERVNARLRDLGLTIRDLAEQTGRGYSYLWKLLRQSTGTAPQRPSQAVREDIAKALGMLPSELEDELNLKDYLVENLHELPEAEMDRLTGGTPNDRFRAVLEWMQADPRWQSAERAAAALGLALETMQALLNGVAPEQTVYRQLQESTSLPIRWWFAGWVPPHPAQVSRLLEHRQARRYVAAVDDAIQRDVPPKTVQNLIKAVKGEAE